ncbi:MAG: putative Ig domain-containing protein, partial [Steroidobacteraceae bacterium]
MIANRMSGSIQILRSARLGLVALGILVLSALAGILPLRAATAASIAPPSDLSYLIPPPFVVGTAIVPLTPSVRGIVSSWSVRPSLPSGLALNRRSGVISGTPDRVAERDTYTITAANSAGSTRFRLPLTVRQAPPKDLSYTTPVVFAVGIAITPLQPTVTGSVRAYSVSPALPAGLVLNRRSGVISGTPTAVSAPAPYVISAANTAGSTSFSLVLSVNSAAPTGLSYPTPTPYFVGIAITALAPSVTGTVDSYTVAPALPAGLVLDPSSGIISGTPSAPTAAQTYVVTASNAIGSAQFNLLLSVIAGPPSALSYPSPALLTLNRVAASLTPTVTGTVDSYTVSPALPPGLTIDAGSGVISGTPTALRAQATYTVTASNGAGDTSFALLLEVDPGPVVHLSGTASDTRNLPLTYYWKTTDGTLVNVNGAEADWQLSAGPGLHFAYLLVGNGSGGYSERRVVVNTDVIGTPLVQFAPLTMTAPPGPSQQGDFYRSFVQAGMTGTSYFGPTASGPAGHLVMAAGMGVYLYANVSPYFPRYPDPPAVTNLRGEYVVPGLPPGTNYTAYCGAQPGLTGNGSCVSDSGWNSVLDNNFTMLPVAMTDWYPGGQHSFQTWPWVVGTLKLSDNSPCGISDEFFGVRHTGTAVYTDAAGTPLFNNDPAAGPTFPAFGPVAVNEFMDFALPSASLLALEAQVGGKTDPPFVQLSCENATPIRIALPSTVGTGITDLGLSAVADASAPTITLIEARYQQQVIATFVAPDPNLPPPARVPSDINPRANAFLAIKGADSRLSAC